MNDSISRCQNCGNPMEPLRALGHPYCDTCWERLCCDNYKHPVCTIKNEECEYPFPDCCEEYVHG